MEEEIVNIKRGNIDTLKNVHKMTFNTLTLCLNKDLDRVKKQIVSLLNYVSDELDIRTEDINIETQPDQK